MADYYLLLMANTDKIRFVVLKLVDFSPPLGVLVEHVLQTAVVLSSSETEPPHTSDAMLSPTLQLA